MRHAIPGLVAARSAWRRGSRVAALTTGLVALVIALLLPAASVADLTVTASPDRLPDANGWYTHPVTVSFVAPDPSFVCTGPVAYSGPDSASASVTGSCTDGTTPLPASFSFQYVATPPAATVRLDRAADNNGWYNHAVGFSVSGSGVATPITCTPGGPPYSGPDNASATVGGSCTDAAGVSSAPASVGFKYDGSAPNVTVTPDRAPNANGWYKDPVTITVAGTDVGPSGIGSCTPSTVYSTPSGANLQFIGSCTDNAGNSSGNETLTFNYASLSVTVSAERAPDLNGWYNHPVTFTAHGTSAAAVTCDSPVAYSGPDTSGTTVALGCTDAAGNNVTGTSASFKYDNTNPAVTVTAGRDPDSDGWYNHAVTITTAGTDGGSGIAACTPPTSYSGPDGASLSASGSCTDNAGNSASASLAFKYASTPPTVVVPADLQLEATVPNGAAAVFTASATDPLDGQPLLPSAVVCIPASGSVFPVGKTTVTCTATDTHGNKGSKSFTVTVTLVDRTKPLVTAPADITREAASGAGAAVTFSATANDNLDGAITPSCAPSSGSTFPLGATTVTCSATDQHLNTGTDTFKITITDTTDPVVHVPADMTAEAASADGAAVTFSASAEDTVNGSLPAPCSPASGSTFPVGSTTVTCHATDSHGNTGNATFHVTIRDTAGPSVTVPADLTREANGPAGARVTFTASASDVVDGPSAVVTCDPASGSTFPLGKTIVTCSASDSHGNSGHSSFAVTVVDTTAPRLNVPAPITLSSPSALPASDSTIAAFLSSANATDLVDGTVAVTNNAPASFPIGTTTVTFTASDKSGHKTVASSTVTVTVATVPPPPPSDAQPPAPVGKLAARASAGAVTLTWVAPPDPDFDHVGVEQSSEGSPLSVVYTGGATSYTAKGLKNGSEYRFVVVSYDKTGNASSEAAIVATPAAAMLVQPKDGAVAKKPPLLDWRDVAGASYYNVQLYRVPSTLKATSGLQSGSKVLSIWPTTSSLRLSAKWVFGKKRYQFSAGTYRWYVWAGFGPRADVKYGPLLGQSTFVVRGH